MGKKGGDFRGGEANGSNGVVFLARRRPSNFGKPRRKKTEDPDRLVARKKFKEGAGRPPIKQLGGNQRTGLSRTGRRERHPVQKKVPVH